MRPPRHRPATPLPPPSAPAPASPHPPQTHRELIAPGAPADRGSPPASTMIRAGSRPLHGSWHLRPIVSPARALLRGGPGGALGGPGRRPSPRASRPPRQRQHTPRRRVVPGQHAAARPGTGTGTFRGQPARATRPRVSSRWREGHRSPSHHHHRVKNRDNGALSAARLSARVVRRLPQPAARMPGCPFSAAPANPHHTGTAPAKAAPGGRSQGAILGAIGGGRYRATQGDTPRQFVQLDALIGRSQATYRDTSGVPSKKRVAAVYAKRIRRQPARSQRQHGHRPGSPAGAGTGMPKRYG
jgi:hypothetical protein